jgi:dTDP-4-amino-4,6-dideoxygalactose transaminase
MVVTDNHDIAGKVDILRRQGCREKYHAEIVGYNSRLDAIQAAILKVKLKYVDQWNEQRRSAAHRYNELLSDSDIKTPLEAPYAYHVYHQYTIRTSKRDELKRLLSKNGIETSIYYPLPLHLQNAFRFLGNEEENFPESERAAKTVLSLPVFDQLSRVDQEYIIRSMKFS